MDQLERDIHLSAQFLATAAINFIKAEADDSHTNLGWDCETKAFLSRELNKEGHLLAINLVNFSIELRKGDKILTEKSLSRQRFESIESWLTEVFRDLGYPTSYKFKLHYDLPYTFRIHDHVFGQYEQEDLMKKAEIRSKAYDALSKLNTNMNSGVEVRTWPHHFDTGFLLDLGSGNSIGIGLAIPDTLVNDYYFYVSGWKGNEPIQPHGFADLKFGRWETNGWNGAILEYSHSEHCEEFLEEAVSVLHGKF